PHSAPHSAPYGAPANAPHAPAPAAGYGPPQAPAAMPAAVPHGRPEAAGAFQPASASAWAQTPDQGGDAVPPQDDWFFDENPDDVPPDTAGDEAPSGRGLASRLPRPGTAELGPMLVTTVITVMSVLLVVASLMWRPDVP
ncbi:hypothetical protein GWI34_34695, partial [Actinomadura sp. DSM 109109]|nr:hypothetical protein [Actinomadura lepetitiana]